MERRLLKRRVKILLPMLLALGMLVAVIALSEKVMESAAAGLSLCARVIIPSLFPFFVISGLISDLGLPGYLGRLTAPFMTKLFGVGGAGASCFVLGISGGYPLGAATVAELYDKGECGKEEAERLLGFCNNTGPAFIIGAAGVGIFKSSATGFWLYLIHIVSAVLAGMLLSGKNPAAGIRTKKNMQHIKVLHFSEAFPKSIKSSVKSTLFICGFVVFFTILTGVLDAMGIVSRICELLLFNFGMSPQITRSLFTGILELGSGIGSMEGFLLSPVTAALSSFILAWGGISVHCQVLSLTGGRGLDMRRYFIGKALHGLIAAVIGFAVFI